MRTYFLDSDAKKFTEFVALYPVCMYSTHASGAGTNELLTMQLSDV